MNWNIINQVTDLAQIVKESASQPVLIFKHSTTCPISGTALNRIERNYDQSKVGDLKPYYLDLLKNRPISNEIASLFGVQHESPQVLIIQNGKATYDASHMAINFNEIANQLA